MLEDDEVSLLSIIIVPILIAIFIGLIDEFIGKEIEKALMYSEDF